MAKVTAPLLSFGGAGQMAKSMVYSTWKGVPYTRRYVIPANPRTPEQTVTRKTFALLREMWKLAPALVVAPWDAFAKGRPFTGMNKFVGENIRVLRGKPDMNDFITSPGAGGGLPPESVTAIAGANDGEIDVTVIAPEAPPGWLLTSFTACAFPNVDPATFFAGPFVAASVAAPGTTVTLTGLQPASECQVGAWLVWEKGNNKVAYSVGITVQAIAGGV